MPTTLDPRDLESAFRRCLGIPANPAASLYAKGWTLHEAAKELWVHLPYLKGVLRGTYQSPRLLRKIANLPENPNQNKP